MTNVGVDTYRTSIGDRFAGFYFGTYQTHGDIQTAGECKNTCISSQGCQSWWFNSSGECKTSADYPKHFVDTPAYPSDRAGKVVNQKLPNTTSIAFWFLIGFFVILFVLVLSMSIKDGQSAFLAKIPYYHQGAIHTFKPIDMKIV